MATMIRKKTHKSARASRPKMTAQEAQTFSGFSMSSIMQVTAAMEAAVPCPPLG